MTEKTDDHEPDGILADMLSSTENYRRAVDKWCIKADFTDYLRWDDEC